MVAVLVGLIFSMSLAIPSSLGAIKAGGTCNKVNAKQSALGKKYICVKSGKKLKWKLDTLSAKAPIAPGVPTESQSSVAKDSDPLDQSPNPVVSASTIYADSLECKLKYASQDTDEYLGFPRGERYPTSMGNRKSIVLFVDFNDLEADSRAIEVWKNRQIPVAEAVYKEISYGRYSVKFDLTSKIYRLAGSYKDYVRSEYVNAAGSTPGVGLEYSKFIRESVKIADSDVDFSQYDFVNVVTPTFTPRAEGGATGGGDFNVDGKTLFLGTVGPIDEYANDSTKDNWLTHEVGHILGLTHVYNFYENTLGAWDFMGNSFGFNELHGWQRWFLGWIEDNQVLCLDGATAKESIQLVSPLGEANKAVKATILKLSPTSALVVEVLRKSSVTKEKTFSEGVIVYKVNTELRGGVGSISILSNPREIQITSGRKQGIIGTLSAGESVESDGFIIKVLKSVKSGDYVSIAKN